jgi:cytoskeleton protein RodZ
MESTGAVLKKRREELGLDRDKIADQLKIRADCLADIENDSFDRLPAPVYSVGYVRSYAAHLRLDPAPFVEYFAQHLDRPRPSTIVPIASFKKKSPKIVYVVFVIVVGIAGWYVQTHHLHRTVSRGFEPKNVRTAGAPEASTGREVRSVPAVAEKGEVSDRHRLDITAVDTTWLAVRFKDGRKDEALLHSGEAKSWEFTETAELKIGNAGGIEIALDGRDLGRPGNPGQVMTLRLPAP